MPSNATCGKLSTFDYTSPTHAHGLHGQECALYLVSFVYSAGGESSQKNCTLLVLMNFGKFVQDIKFFSALEFL